MKWLLGGTIIFGFVFGAWYLSIDHIDPISLALERKIDPVAAACSETQRKLEATEDGSDPAPPAPAEPVSACWQAIHSLLVDVTPLLKGDREGAVKQLAGWEWMPAVSVSTAHLPSIQDESVRRVFFDRLLGPRREWWDPRPAVYGCSRSYQVALDTIAGGGVVKAYAYWSNGFTVCS